MGPAFEVSHLELPTALPGASSGVPGILKSLHTAFGRGLVLWFGWRYLAQAAGAGKRTGTEEHHPMEYNKNAEELIEGEREAHDEVVSFAEADGVV